MSCNAFLILSFLLFILTTSLSEAVIDFPSHDEVLWSRKSSSAVDRIPECPASCFCSGDSISCLNWTGEERIKFPKTTTALTIEGYWNPSFNSSILDDLQELQWLKISPGNLENFPILPNLPRLSILDISGNKIKSLPSGVMGKLPQLMHLKISSNQIDALDEDFLIDTKALRILDLSNNSISYIPPTFFSHTKKLASLDLSRTNLNRLSPVVIEHLPNLYYFNISYNNFIVLPTMEINVLEVLDISHNPFQFLPKIVHLPNLSKMLASHTSISVIHFSDGSCNKLTLLDLSYSNLTSIETGAFQNCVMLHELQLNNNSNLQTIKYEAFLQLNKLNKLYLNNCPNLGEMERDIFEDVPNLQELHLKNTGIQVLPPSLKKLQNLTLLSFENNSIKCDCNAHWLPQWIKEMNETEWKGLNTFNCIDGYRRSLEELDNHIELQECRGVEVVSQDNKWVLAPWRQSTILDCNATGFPQPVIIWQTSKHHLLVHSKVDVDQSVGYKILKAFSIAKETSKGKYQVLKSGQLLVKDVQRDDIGRFKCFAFNAVSNSSSVVFLGIQDEAFRRLYQESILFGLLCAAVFFFLTLLIQFTKYIMDRLGCECCCCRHRLSPKAQQVRQLLESVEAYKSAQLDKLKENYNSQVSNIKDSCYQQMERLRESYSQQSKNLKDLCDYSTQQLQGARDQYVDQVNKVRDYSISQMNRVRENYIFQRQRIRKFSAHQLIRLRETYKYQQKTLNKLLETLPDLYIQNCRTGACQRTDSIIFDELDGLDVYYKVDFLDCQSYNSSYYTPSSTLTRQQKGTNKQTHSRNPSSTSGGTDYHEANSWLVRSDVLKSDKAIATLKLHGRSLSIAAPTGIHYSESLKSHKRSSSASHPHQIPHPKLPLMEEISPTSPQCPSLPTSENSSVTPSLNTPLYTPLPSPISLSPIHQSSKECLESKNQSNLISPSDAFTISEVLSDSSDNINVKNEFSDILDITGNSSDNLNEKGDSLNENCVNITTTQEETNSVNVSYETSL